MKAGVALELANDRPRYTGGSNVLLENLSEPARSLLRPHLSQRDFVVDDMLLWKAGEPSHQIYFPHSGLISIAIPNDEGHIEVGSISRHAAVGFQTADAGTCGRVLVGGCFSIISTCRFREAARQNDELASLVSLANEWLLTQAQRMAACNAIHSCNARLCRWLALASASVESNLIHVTQEDIGCLLGLRRTTVTLMAQKLHADGIINYSRGRITIRDRTALEAGACSCLEALDRKHWPSTRLAALGLSHTSAAHLLGNPSHRGSNSLAPSLSISQPK